MDVYVLNHCDAWHSYESFRFIGVVDEEHLQECLDAIQDEMDYTEEDMEKFIDLTCVELNDVISGL